MIAETRSRGGTPAAWDPRRTDGFGTIMLDLAAVIRRSWPVFLEAIRMRRTLTYSELSGRVGPPLNRRNVHRQLLIPLSERCRMLGLPDPAALVVRKDSGLPGGGWHDPRSGAGPAAAWAAALERCFAFQWPETPPRALLEPRERRSPADPKSP